jgi:hypothetical protein
MVLAAGRNNDNADKIVVAAARGTLAMMHKHEMHGFRMSRRSRHRAGFVMAPGTALHGGVLAQCAMDSASLGIWRRRDREQVWWGRASL